MACENDTERVEEEEGGREGSVLNRYPVRKVALIYHVESTRASIACVPRTGGINF